MSSLNDSVIIVNHFCYKCEKTVDLLNSDQNCGECGTGFVEEIEPTPKKSKTPIKEEKLVSPLKDTPERQECCICLQIMDNSCEQTVRLVCTHIYHKPCLKNWLKMANNCPLCRSHVDVPSVVTPIRRPQFMRSYSTAGHTIPANPTTRILRSRSPIRSRDELLSGLGNNVGNRVRSSIRGLRFMNVSGVSFVDHRIVTVPTNDIPADRHTNRTMSRIMSSIYTVGPPHLRRERVDPDHLRETLRLQTISNSNAPQTNLSNEDNWVFPPAYGGPSGESGSASN